MRTTVIPAQITTVEDRIAGSLNFTQILLLLTPVGLAMGIYAFFSPAMHLSLYKLPLVTFFFILCGILALRIRGKLILDWVIIISKFNVRPAFYIFDKNDRFERMIDLPIFEKKSFLPYSKNIQKKKKVLPIHLVEVSDLVQLEHLVQTHRLSFKAGKKGGFNVALE